MLEINPKKAVQLVPRNESTDSGRWTGQETGRTAQNTHTAAVKSKAVQGGQHAPPRSSARTAGPRGQIQPKHGKDLRWITGRDEGAEPATASEGSERVDPTPGCAEGVSDPEVQDDRDWTSPTAKLRFRGGGQHSFHVTTRPGRSPPARTRGLVRSALLRDPSQALHEWPDPPPPAPRWKVSSQDGRRRRWRSCPETPTGKEQQRTPASNTQKTPKPWSSETCKSKPRPLGPQDSELGNRRGAPTAGTMSDRSSRCPSP